MQHDAELVAEVRAWLSKAAGDLRAAELLIAARPPLLSEAAFHCQQTVEKALKGFLAFRAIPFRKTHNLEEIGEACVSADSTLKPVVDRAVPFSDYAWRFRYPADDQTIDETEAGAALNTGREILNAVLVRLPPEFRP